MAISRDSLLNSLRKGSTITTFYRKSHKRVAELNTPAPDGYLLLSPNKAEESLLTYTEFQSVKNELIEIESWQEKMGGTVFGGSCWRLKS
ncbi:intracellular growth attenuator family protein [Providencia stuartii]|uniref:intracellular growth attenuator family protein n=1 Tax=Providencia stuartii TaxID=588 RepID=UPI001122BEDD